MKVGIFDFETSGLSAESSIVLCCCIKTYDPDKKHVTKVKTIRADKFPSWERDRLNQKDFIAAVAKELDDYDILVAHNGVRFDVRFFNAKCVQFGIKPILRGKKIADPVRIARRHMKLSRNSLASLIDFFDVKTHKTPIEFKHWLKALVNGSKASMDVIIRHCIHDVIALEEVYRHVKVFVDKIDNKGSDL